MSKEFEYLKEHSNHVNAIRIGLIMEARRQLVGKRVRFQATIAEVEGVVEDVDNNGTISIVYSYLASGRSYHFSLPVENIGSWLTLVEEEE